MSKSSIVILDDHAVVRQGLARVINNQETMTVSASFQDGQGLLHYLQTEKPDLVISDLSLKDINGLELIKTLHFKYPELHILVLSMHDETMYADRVLKAGARGYIMKEKVTKELIKAINTVLNNGIYTSEELSQKMLESSLRNKIVEDVSTDKLLTDRELEVLEYTGDGLTTEEIADKLMLGTKTIETYKTRIKEKLSLKNVNQLIKYAVEWRLKTRL
ncbi:MAG: hypothetical protein A2015_13895 [Spirochaetes bacterium GWF1_31_7]|nr:MAG: hypothetical protein A2Y30_10930 [Spirochaetes bacterium GWE1_32_154]OHD46168.1 MAG: hypothetical protein A2Y29_08690 [Spirochaetes bacterium GWE2_31_10]OHD49910.1 MAG: hypothetical protein A2015_13895 [Spirochaetes bacterium GWF1_31_7]OHD74385.1 MAG: hypothetical protein A2355_01895 [Spirochaetes bacterium RIFOXYB1_FULL_32_8]